MKDYANHAKQHSETTYTTSVEKHGLEAQGYTSKSLAMGHDEVRVLFYLFVVRERERETERQRERERERY